MVSFCEEVVREVGGASNEIEVREILGRALKNYQLNSGADHSLLVLNLIVSLRAAWAERKNPDTSGGLLIAIDVLREHQKNAESKF